MITAFDFLSQARYLLNKSDATEIDYRSAISRAYYSLYHESYKFLTDNYKKEVINLIESFLFSKNIMDSVLNNNENLEKFQHLDADYIMRLGISFHQIIPNVLRSLNYNYFMDYKQHRKKRNLADYNLDISISYDYAKFEIEFISDLILNIKNL